MSLVYSKCFVASENDGTEPTSLTEPIEETQNIILNLSHMQNNFDVSAADAFSRNCRKMRIKHSLIKNCHIRS